MGPSFVVDGVEMVGFSTEFSARINTRKFSENDLNDVALKLHQQFANSVNAEVQKAAGLSAANLKVTKKPKPKKVLSPKKSTPNLPKEEEESGSRESAASKI